MESKVAVPAEALKITLQKRQTERPSQSDYPVY